MSDIKIFNNEQSNTIFVAHGSIGSWPYHCLQAIEEDGLVCIRNKAKLGAESSDFFEFTDRSWEDFVDDQGQQHGSDVTTTVNALNAIFNHTSDANPPVITGSTAVSGSTTVSINYTLEGTGISGVEWGALPSGLAVDTSNRRTLLGQITSAGTYSVDFDAVNAFGSTSGTVTFTISSGFTNTKSVSFSNFDYLDGDASRFATTLGRTGSGAGAGDAWTIHFWFKPGTANNNNQTILYFGDNDKSNGNHIVVKYVGGNDLLRVRYGSDNNHLKFDTPTDSLVPGEWIHVLVTYDGGTTGASSGDISDYYSRFKIYLDGQLQSTSDTNSNYGITTSLDGDVFEISRGNDDDYMRSSCRLEEIALWSSDQNSNVAAIYNGGSTQDLSGLGTPPTYWWRMGDGDTYPDLGEVGGNSLDDLVMNNMSANDIVSDVP